MAILGTRRVIAVAAACAAVAVAGCGSDDGDDTTGKDSSAPAAAANEADLGAIKTYLLEHTSKLATDTGTLREQAEGYYDLAESVDFDYHKLLTEHRAEVQKFVKD